MGYPRHELLVQYLNVIYSMNRLKKPNHMIISISAEKAPEKIQHPFMILKNNLSEKERDFSNLIRSIYVRPTVSIIINDKD